MRFSFAITVFMAAAVSSQSVSSIVAQIPSCALTCLATGAAAAGCGVSDYACQCAKKAEITTAATPCVLGGCPQADALKTLSVVEELCKAVGGAGQSTTSAPAAGAATTGTTPVSGIGAAPTTVGSSIVYGSSIVSPTKATTAPAQVPTGAASRMQAGVGVIGGAVLLAMAL